MYDLFPVYCDDQDWTRLHKRVEVRFPHDYSISGIELAALSTEHWSQEKIKQHFAMK